MPQFFKRKKEVKPKQAEKKDELVETKVSEPEKQVTSDCGKCQTTGLELPEGNIKFKGQAVKNCEACEGSGKII